MSEIENNQAANPDEGGESKQQAETDQKSADNTEKKDTGVNQEAGQGGESPEADKGEKANKAKAPTDNPKKEDKSDDEFKDDGSEPPTRSRMSSKDFIIARQRAKISKQQKADKNDDESDDDDDIAPEDEELITKVVAKKFAPIIDRTQEVENEREISDFIAKNQDFKPFVAKVRRYINHPSRRNLPVESIFYEVAGESLLKIGAQRQQKADEEARQTQTGGGSARGGGGEKSTWALSEEEFEAEKEKVRRGQPD